MALFDARGIDHVGIRYRDLPRAVAWFRDVLGLPIEHEARTMAVAALRAAGVPLRPVGPNLGFEDPEGTVFHFMSARVG